MNYKNKKIVIMGLGSYEKGSGISTAVFLAKGGAKLVITDLKTEQELAPQLKRIKKFKNIEHVLGKHRKKDFEDVDFIVRNPSVPKKSLYLEIARQNNIPIINDWTIFFEERTNNLVIGITGTKGKSTTAALIHHVLKQTGKDSVLCGNIGQSPLSVLDKIKKDTIVVAELSSWLLSDLKQSPQIAVLTNLMPDHLDKYESLSEYYKDKENIFKFQKSSDYLIRDKQGKEAVFEVAKILGISKKNFDKALETFRGIPGRLELVKEKNGVKYYNDTCATTPEAVIYALNSLKEHKGKVILIAGGVDKKLDYKNLAQEISKYCKSIILFKGTASDKIIKVLRQAQDKNYELRIGVKNMKDAVKIAKNFAQKGDVVLLSPGAASFNLFKNELDRGEQFVKAIR